MAEALLNHHGSMKFQAYSAGSNPTGQVHPLALETLESRRIPSTDYHSKSWDKITQPIDIVITVCGSAAEETCPIWNGSPITTHWGVEDPAYFEGNETEKRAEFSRVCDRLEQRILTFLELSPKQRINQSTLDKIGAL